VVSLWFVSDVLYPPAGKSVNFIKAKKSILIQDKKANKAKQDNQQSVHHSLTAWSGSVVHPPSLF
jgi:hypothetical protein